MPPRQISTAAYLPGESARTMRDTSLGAVTGFPSTLWMDVARLQSGRIGGRTADHALDDDALPFVAERVFRTRVERL